MSDGRFSLFTESFDALDADTRAAVLGMARRPEAAGDRSAVELRVLVARDPATPDTVRVELSADPSAEVREVAVTAGLTPAGQRDWAQRERLEDLDGPCEHLDDPQARLTVALRLAAEGDLDDAVRAARLKRLVARVPLGLDSARALVAECAPRAGDVLARQIASMLVGALREHPEETADEVLAVCSEDDMLVAVAASTALNVSDAARERVAERLVVAPLRAAAPFVPAALHEVIYRFKPLPPAAHAEVARLVAAADLSGCSRARYLRERFVNTAEVQAKTWETAITTSDPEVLALLVEDNVDRDAHLAAAVIENPATPTAVACAAVGQLSVGYITGARRARPDDIEFLAVLVRRFPGMIDELAQPARTQVADRLLAGLPDGPLSRDALEWVSSITVHASPAGFESLPCVEAAEVIAGCPTAAEWFAGRVAAFGADALEVLCALAGDASGTLGALLDAAEAAVRPVRP